MSRPRIRTLKPECWQDEKLGQLGSWERLLFVGLITMADDEGRLRLLLAAIGGFVFPYDEAALPKIRKWIGTVAEVGLVTIYEAAGREYVQINGWGKHQRIDKPSPSELPAPPGMVSE